MLGIKDTKGQLIAEVTIHSALTERDLTECYSVPGSDDKPEQLIFVRDGSVEKVQVTPQEVERIRAANLNLKEISARARG